MGLVKGWAVVFATLLSACATVAVSGDKGSSETRQVRDANYQVGVERTVVVGDAIIRVRDFAETVTETASMEANENFQISGGVVTIPIARGERLPVFGQRDVDGVAYTVVRKGEFGIQVAPDGSVGPGVINGLGTDIQVVMAYRFSTSSPTARFRRVVDTRSQRTPTGSNFEIVFNGIDGQAMRFQYREYTANDMARPAFFQELSYPLGTRTLRFREMVINVAAIDAQQIRYTVASDGVAAN